MEKWLQDFPPPSAAEREKQKSAARPEREAGSAKQKAAREAKKRNLFPAELDLHGMRREEAALRLRDFLRNSLRGGLRKVLVIHGRGLHSNEEAVLPALVRKELEQNPSVADFGPADPSQGGGGATQVFLKQDKRWR